MAFRVFLPDGVPQAEPSRHLFMFLQRDDGQGEGPKHCSSDFEAGHGW